MSDAGLQAKLERMKEVLRGLERVAVGFSAGVDSTFLLKVAVDTLGPANVVAVTADSESLTRRELDEARKLAAQMGVEHVVVRTDELDDPNYRANPANRCYYCKQALFRRLDEFIAGRGAMVMVIGVNTDDFADWRPGLRASKEKGVRMPAAEAGMSKADVRELSRQMGLPTHDKPSSPCLASRLPYGEEITPEKLSQIERSEAFLHSLGFHVCRVRHHGNMARIEVPADQIERLCEPATRAKVDATLREFGYQYVAVDIRGFRSGSLNEMLSPSQTGVQAK
ncbi:MAG TPA: ATP-dependent sacrificial sulfur transferase LarE [Phycisphaerae bacterium]|nr:ATP-dependent sacrificial sulfur transferase LarE [Phycisphaerae bacterium]HRR84488.1 ATP-dependent sacrificial sulfur transferase LarE [Phycisphaerae bacterium]